MKGAEKEINERTLRLDNGCYRCIAQLQFLRQIQHTMDDGHRELQERTLRVLVEKLTVAKSLLRKLVSVELSSHDVKADVKFVPKPLKLPANLLKAQDPMHTPLISSNAPNRHNKSTTQPPREIRAT